MVQVLLGAYGQADWCRLLLVTNIVYSCLKWCSLVFDCRVPVLYQNIKQDTIVCQKGT